MKKIITFKDGSQVEFTECTFRFDGERIEGLYIHDLADEFGDGDGVVGNACTLPEDADDAEQIISNECIETDSEVLETVELKKN